MNSDRVHTRHSLQTQSLPIVDLDASEQTDKRQLRKSKRIAKNYQKKNSTKQQTQNQPEKKQRFKKRKLKRVKSTINLNLNQQEPSQRLQIVPKRKILKKSKKQKPTRRTQPQRIDSISLSTDQNVNIRQVDRVAGRPVQRSRRMLASGSNTHRTSLQRQNQQTRNPFNVQLVREPLRASSREPRSWRMYMSSSSQSEYGITDSSQLRRRQRANPFRQNVISFNEPIPNRIQDRFFSVNQDKDQQNLNWFISKNKIFTNTSLTQQKIDKCDKCIICYADWINHDEVNEQQIKPLPQDTKPYLQMKGQVQTEKIQKKKQQTDNQKQNDQHLLMELFCQHFFHRSCIEKWFQTKKICPCCRKDFRKHEAYKQWDINYQKRIKPESSSGRLFDFRSAWEPPRLSYSTVYDHIDGRRFTHREQTNPFRLFQSDLNQSMEWTPSYMELLDQPIDLERSMIFPEISYPALRLEEQNVSQMFFF